MRIIDKDIDLWQATLECHESQLFRCPPSYEVQFQRKRAAADAVLQALRAYREVVDQYPALPSVPPFDSEPFV